MVLKIKSISLILMFLFYITAGIYHFINPEFYVRIVPPVLPYKFAIVYVTGFLEIILGSLLIFQNTRYIAGWGLIIFLLLVFPSNIYVAMTNGEAMGTSPFIAWGRLPLQFPLIAIAFWHSKE